MLDRCALMLAVSAALLAARRARAATVTDGAGRAVPVPARVERVFPAGPPAAILLYTLAPDCLIGWPRANSPAEREFLLADIGARPEVGRITGRGNTANLEVVLALKPDLILDVGSVNPTYVSLADRVQQQTGVPYALLDGRFDAVARSYRTLGALIGRDQLGDEYAHIAEQTINAITQRIAAVPPQRRPRVYYARGPRGLETGLGGSINVETIELLAHHHHRSGFRRECLERPGLGADRRGARAARAPFAKAAVWLGRFSAEREPADWTVVACQDPLSRAVSRGPARAYPRFLRAVLSCADQRRADRSRAGRTGLNVGCA